MVTYIIYADLWEHEAVLVDTAVTEARNVVLGDWIESTIPTKRLSFIYITLVMPVKLAVCGDVVYGDVHQQLRYANTKALREE